MINVAFTLIRPAIPTAEPRGHVLPETPHRPGLLSRLRTWALTRIRYERALRELGRLDDRDLDDINIARVDFPKLAWRHAIGAAPLRASLA